MTRHSERGEGRMGTIIGFLVFGAVCLASWNVIPVYIANYSFADKLNEFARAPRYRNPDEKIMSMIMKEASEQRIDVYMTPQNCKITTREHSRTIECDYEREVEVLPGWKHTFRFTPGADQPLL